MGCCHEQDGFQRVGKRPVVVQQGFRTIGWLYVIGGEVFRVLAIANFFGKLGDLMDFYVLRTFSGFEFRLVSEHKVSIYY